MPEADDHASRRDEVVGELADCRQRGIEWLDRRSHNQDPLNLPRLERLAREYVEAKGLKAHGRVSQIKNLLRDSIAEYERQGNADDAGLISDLFFGDATGIVLRSAGQLLYRARARTGENDDRFRERRRMAFRAFAGFLPQFVNGARIDAVPGSAGISVPELDAADRSGPSATGYRAATGDLGLAAAPDGQQSEQRRIERALETASSIILCGIAPRTLVDAMRRVAKQLRAAGKSTPWREITYITPASALIFATQGHARLGSAMQEWQFALKGVRDCILQLQADAEEAATPAPPVRLALLGVMELFVEVVLLTKEHDTERERLWVSVGPNLARDEPLYFSFEKGTKNFGKIEAMVNRLGGISRPIVSRELEVRPDGLEQISRLDSSPQEHRLEVRAVQPIGASMPLPTCLPVALVILRSAEAGRPVVLLKQRSRYTNLDQFDKLSLLSARLLEEDLAGALGLPIFPDRDAAAALDAMWKAYGKPDRLPIPLGAFVRAAQRDVFRSCGLDIATGRFAHRGCHLLEREERGLYLFLCVFEVILYRHRDEDELQLAREWNPEFLESVYEDMLYDPGIKEHLNRFLVQRQEWLEAEIFSKPVALIEQSE